MAEEHFITPAVAREVLLRAYRSDAEINIHEVLLQYASDPIKPVAENGRMRPRLTLVVTCIVVLFLITSFLYFSFGGRG